MDISSLLSPSETPRGSSSTPGSAASSQSPFKHVQRTHSGNTSQPSVSSPLTRAIQPPSSIPAHVRSPSQQPAHSSPLISPVPTATLSGQFPRSSSTPGMDGAAEGSGKSHTTSKPTPPILPTRDSSDSQRSSSSIFPHLTSAGTTAKPRASFDIAMVDTPKQVLRADYTDTSLSEEAQQRLATLVAYVHETPSSYEAHTEIIRILHQGLVDHIYPSTNPNERRDPKTYDLIGELRQARENLDKLFAVGEEQWLDWLQDESLLAQTAEERVAVVDKCRRAVTEEFGSTRLWVTYGDWVLHCHKWALGPPADGENDDAAAETERMVGREVFDWNLVLDTWAEGIERTKHDMSHSHEVWDKYMTIRFGDTSQKLSSTDAAAVLDLYQSRLSVPHAEWQQTFQAFSTFVSANLPAEQYEGTMASTLKTSANARKLWEERDTFETAVEQAQKSGDRTLEYQAFSKYIEWERSEGEKSRSKKQKGKRGPQTTPPPFDMVEALYQRAELRFPSVLAAWEEHIDYLLDQSKPNIVEILSRATKHCPWSGSLWKQYLLASEVAEEPFDETEKIKHKATSSGLLEAAGIEEALTVYDAWCGYLLRRSKRPDAVEEDADVAEMGIRSSIETVHSLASKLELGADFDPSFRLQRKYVEYLKFQRRFDNARAQFDDAVPDYGKHYKFWLRFYEFELQKSVQMAFVQHAGPDRLAALSSAPFAAAILKQGLQFPGLDYPEPLMEALLNHCEDYEDAEELQSALAVVRKAQRLITAKRQEEIQRNEIALQAEKAKDELKQRTEEVANGLHIGKRKRDSQPEGKEDDTNKRYKADDAMETSEEPQNTTEEQLKRDREHASVLVQNLPSNITETKIRQYFSSCGIVKNLKLLPDEGSVVVEFEDADAATYALSRHGRELEGSVISVVLNTGSTLYVTNYPAAADETWIRNLLRPYGEIINIRFPSLQRNKRRRFCYVEFKLPKEAQAATELDGKEIKGLNIVVKISNPAARQPRAEKRNDGRTVFVGQLPFKATTEDIEKAFSQYGKLDNIRLPHDPKNKSRNRGIAFLTFARKEEAEAALAMDGQEFVQRKITVHIDSEGNSRDNKSDRGRSKSPSAQPSGSSTALPTKPERDPVSIEERRQRTVAICEVPDTVNESRIKAVAEKIGPVRKVLLKTNHQGALVEFETIPDAGRGMIELDGYEISPGRRIRVTTEKELFQMKPERKEEQFAKRPNQNQRPAPAANGPIKRPAQPGVRKGGHLGQRIAVLHSGEKKGTGTEEQVSEGKKTNEDFRNLVNKG
ncbi:putative RNA-binding protein [Exophiala dermatitidis]